MIMQDREGHYKFEEAFIKYSDMVTRISILNLRNSADAKDCFQNVFIKLYQYRCV